MPNCLCNAVSSRFDATMLRHSPSPNQTTTTPPSTKCHPRPNPLARPQNPTLHKYIAQSQPTVTALLPTPPQTTPMIQCVLLERKPINTGVLFMFAARTHFITEKSFHLFTGRDPTSYPPQLIPTATQSSPALQQRPHYRVTNNLELIGRIPMSNLAVPITVPTKSLYSQPPTVTLTELNQFAMSWLRSSSISHPAPQPSFESQPKKIFLSGHD